jgi:hypothetical protein
LAWLARSRIILRSALLLFVGWLVFLAEWYFTRGDVRLVLYALTDAALAGAFFYMSKGRWFPVPLFFLYATQIPYHAYAAFIGSPPFWVALLLNRFFEAALLYVMGCSVYRISRLRRVRSKVAHEPPKGGGGGNGHWPPSLGRLRQRSGA